MLGGGRVKINNEFTSLQKSLGVDLFFFSKVMDYMEKFFLAIPCFSSLSILLFSFDYKHSIKIFKRNNVYFQI